MRIISKSKDYYDSALALGRDETLVFVRNTSDGDVSIAKALQDMSQNSDSFRAGFGHTAKQGQAYRDSIDKEYLEVSLILHVIGFCGKLYPFIKFSASSWDGTAINEVCYLTEDLTNEQFDDYCNKIKKLAPAFFDGRYVYGSRFKKDVIPYVARLRSYATEIASHANSFEPYFIEHKVPYFVVDMVYSTVEFLPTLQDYSFFKVKDAYTAMQELSMYLGGVIPKQEKETVTISDKDRIYQHGFDKKSFRHPVK